MADGNFVSSCERQILAICREKSPGFISVTDIYQAFKLIDPMNKLWEVPMTAKGKVMKDNVYKHNIRMALMNLVGRLELSNAKYMYYRFATDEDRDRMFLDPYKVWTQVLRNARTESLENNLCESPDGNDKYRFVIIDQKPHIYTKTNRNAVLIKKEAVYQIVQAINLEPNGRVQRGWKDLAMRSAIVHCCDELFFDNEGWITCKKNTIYNVLDAAFEGQIIVDTPIPQSIRGLVKRAKYRAQGGTRISNRYRKKIPHDIEDDSWIEEKEKLTHCEVTGIPFTLGSPGPFQRSLDQRIPGNGYSKENTDVVVLIYNYAKSTYSAEEVRSFCEQFVANKGLR